MQQLTRNVYAETTFHGANLGCIVTGEGLVLIDAPPNPTNAVKWQKEVNSKGEVKYLINTEAHEDHIIGAFFFPVPVISHEKTRDEIIATSTKELLDIVAAIDPAGLPLVKDFKKNVPTITFSEALTLYMGKHTFQLIYLPGHTPGQTAVLIPEEKVLFTGDNITNKMQNFLHSANPIFWLESLKKIEELEFEHLVPGHGPVCDKSVIAEQYRYIERCIETIKKAIDGGMTREEALGKVSLPERFPLPDELKYFGPIMLKQSVGRLYDALSQRSVSLW